MAADPVVPEVPVPAVPAAAGPSAAVAAPADADDVSSLEVDSAFGDDLSDRDSKTSLQSSVAQYRFENGRSYHGYKDGKYLMPNDEVEQDRMDLHHHLFTLLADGKIYEAPIVDPKRVLDVGTGTGIWAIDFADLFPSAHVIGVDLSPIQPTWCPPNLEFQIDDVESPWTFNQKFDYIHLRILTGSIKNYPALVAQVYENLAPGGWIECAEFECWVRNEDDDPEGRELYKECLNAPMIQKWIWGLKDAGEKIGREFNTAVNLKKWVTEAGFVNVNETMRKVPCTRWPKDKKQKQIGAFQQMNMLDGVYSFGTAHFTRVLGWSNLEYDLLATQVKSEFKNDKLRLYGSHYFVQGQKPLEAVA